MSSFSTIAKADLTDILSNYEIGSINHYRVLDGGSENTNLYLESADKKYVLSICEQKTVEEAEVLGDLLKHLEENNFKTSKVITTKEKRSTSIWNEKPVILKEFLPGIIDKNPSESLIKKIVQNLTSLHKLKAPMYLPRQFSYGIQCFEEIKVLAPESEFSSWLMNIKDYLNGYLDSSLPKCLIHGDIYFSNVIVYEDKVTIMDFEEACYYYRVFDLGMLIIGTCCDKLIPDLSKIKVLLSTYNKVNKLTAQELRSLKAFTIYAASATAFWRYRKFNHLNPIPELFDHYKDLQNLVNKLKIIPDNVFLDI